MMDIAAVEALRATGATQAFQFLNQPSEVTKVADPKAVEAFKAAMGPGATESVPFASKVADTWKAAHDNNQALLHRITALSEMGQSPSIAQLSQLQYEIANLSFQQEVVTSVAKKASGAIETLVKNG